MKRALGSRGALSWRAETAATESAELGSAVYTLCEHTAHDTTFWVSRCETENITSAPLCRPVRLPGGRVLSQDARGPREQRSGQQRSGEQHVHSETMGDDESDAGPPKTPRQPESGWDVGGGWDIGQRAAVPMPYYVFPENKDTVVLCRNQEDFASAVHQPRRCREERLKRHARAMMRGQGSPAVGSPYAPLGDVADLEMPTRASTRESSRLKNLRVVYPRPLASKDNRERTPRPLRLGRIDAGYAYEREYCH